MQYIIAIAKGENPPKPATMYSKDDSSQMNFGRKRPSSPSGRDEPPYKYDNRNTDGFKIDR